MTEKQAGRQAVADELKTVLGSYIKNAPENYWLELADRVIQAMLQDQTGVGMDAEIKAPKFRKISNGAIVEAVEFLGSSTQIHALRKWISGEPYSLGSVQTQDIKPFQFNSARGNVMVYPHDYVVKDVDEKFFLIPHFVFLSEFRLVE